MWIVMNKWAKMPNTCWGKYKRVALVRVSPDYAATGREPRMISTHARGVLEIIDLGHHNVGKTDRCAFGRAIASAQARADELNKGSEVSCLSHSA